MQSPAEMVERQHRDFRGEQREPCSRDAGSWLRCFAGESALSVAKYLTTNDESIGNQPRCFGDSSAISLATAIMHEHKPEVDSSHLSESSCTRVHSHWCSDLSSGTALSIPCPKIICSMLYITRSPKQAFPRLEGIALHSCPHVSNSH